jgi:hypothetical protein
MHEQPIHTSLPPVELDEPHFDDEATLLSARPVVPLAAVRSQNRTNKWLFVVAIVAAMLSGAVGAKLIYSRSANAIPQTNQAIITNETPAATVPSPAGSPQTEIASPPVSQHAASTGASSGERPESERPTTTLKSKKDDAVAIPHRTREQTSKSRRAEKRSDDDEQKVDEREDLGGGKRERRVSDRRNRGNSDSDLFRIREIFEGSPRP